MDDESNPPAATASAGAPGHHAVTDPAVVVPAGDTVSGPDGDSPSPTSGPDTDQSAGRWQSVTQRFVRWRAGVRQRRTAYAFYRLAVALVGGVFVVGGLALVPLPGPGWLVVILGLIVLASEFVWAAHVLGFTRRTLTAWTEWVKASPVWVRVGLAAGTAAVVLAVGWTLLRVSGVPGWVPDGWLDWVPGL
ncbi:MAG: PGPGW domain-containing protein [Kineosporiaceae bacterium]